jgi:hypothetical protein
LAFSPPPDYCTALQRDFGDAPEGIDAYPGVTGHFPTCLADGAAGDQTGTCRFGTAPGPTGYVLNETRASDDHFWLGCPMGSGGPGIDSESNGKVSLTSGGSTVGCLASVTPDCSETAFGLTFGQDECTGGDDAGIAAQVTLTTCTQASIPFTAWSCAAVPIQAYLNILVDMNHDGDWNDDFNTCNVGVCASEWAIKNAPIVLQPECNSLISPAFPVGPNAGPGWMRITLSKLPVIDDFPWAGSATTSGGVLVGGETEDYPVAIAPTITGVRTPGLPRDVWLAAFSPNPGLTRTAARFGLPRKTHVSIAVFDAAGRRVAQLLDAPLAAGEHAIQWDYRNASGSEVPVGVYLVRMEAEGRVVTRGTIHVR